MKKLTLNLLTLGVLAIVLSGCGGVKKMVENSPTVKYDVNPSPLETHAGDVEVTVKTTFPEKYFNKKAVVTATPILKYEGGQTEFESTVLQGEKVEANNQVISWEGGSYTFTGKVPYNADMLKSELVVDMAVQIKEKDAIPIPGIKIADGVIATPTLVQNKPKAILMPDNFQRVIPETYDAEILYVINKSDVRNSELKKEEVEAFQEKIAKATKDSTIQIKGAKISSYASPDGELELNEKLSGNRGTSAERYLTRALKKMDVEGYDVKGFLSTIETAEDWDGFKELMEASDIQDKQLILRVLSMYSDPAVREKEIKNISEAYEEIKTEVLPLLRRSQMMINVDNIGYTDEEIAAFSKDAPEKLTVEELLYAAALTDDNAEKLRIYNFTANKFPEEIRAINNVGFVSLAEGDVAGAKAAFEKAKAIKDTDIVKNNLGAVALADGDLATAEQLFTSAMSAGDAVSYNLGIIKIKQGDYTAAVNYFGNKPSFNAGLAQLLNGDANKCLSTLGELGDTDCAPVYYLKAVAGARSANDQVVISNLRLAIEKDAAMKDYAKKDCEFLKYAGNEAFVGIIQ
ncbi:MAG: tetratricopeptide repeat protein [Bacteroidales bacterium]|nr:tetratricopeptide repeat protein [Bacteroidales bacterium]